MLVEQEIVHSREHKVETVFRQEYQLFLLKK